ncbi:uncharacterized protein B0H18DRAFT_959632 [Fomitopsis serialis]|uniref:uncharacterized protein n=1 Tax=Fomitopsis serialis TaxID=139415 RepID=UPI002007AB2B|nr:uncharacterized protein B0H18DRAFT_960713 [Neoantrodia serialis]XP_047886781.1 uncharacterized protein B0H18DRAFT_959632 [Neoantrodia serialis]KAH9912948.1 hypothetical protein B0H18DRAFT_960713 [Neoantrodia serialis]KAH9914814.1 hypothetical protein B0H18DRAFT_959632 [Neoantrodia serialis]
MSLPLMCRVHDHEIELPFRQPITEQALPGLNPFKKRKYGDPPQFEVYDVDSGMFLPLRRLTLTTPLHLRLPLSHIPVFKYAHVNHISNPRDIALGTRNLGALCSMKVGMYDLPFVLPTALPIPRLHMRAEWVLKRRSFPMTLERPLKGEPGYSEEVVGGEVPVDAPAHMAEDVADDEDGVEIWEVMSNGKEVAYVPNRTGGYSWVESA